MFEKIKENYKVAAVVGALGVAVVIALAAVLINLFNNGGRATINYSDEQRSAVIELGEDDANNEDSEYYGLGEAGEEIEIEVPTVDEIDGGQFEDADTGVSVLDGEYDDLGAAIEIFDTSTPQAFRNAVLGKCVIANNRYGAQCASLARSFWWSYADRDVSTCGTGAAKGMMNCYEQNAGDDFLVYWASDVNGIQAGDWLVFSGGTYGHVGMALGGVYNGYVALLGENQGGASCTGGGAAANIINMSVKNLIGYYRPKSYVKPEPTPTPEQTPVVYDNYVVKKGDTLGEIARNFCSYTGKKLFGDDGYAESLAKANSISDRGLIYPKQIILNCPAFN